MADLFPSLFAALGAPPKTLPFPGVIICDNCQDRPCCCCKTCGAVLGICYCAVVKPRRPVDPEVLAAVQVLKRHGIDGAKYEALQALRAVPAGIPEQLPALSQNLPLKRLQDHPDFRHTCITCGRTGTRRYVRTPAGWQCSTRDACERRAAETAAAADRPAPRPPGRGVPDLCITHGIVGPHDCAEAS